MTLSVAPALTPQSLRMDDWKNTMSALGSVRDKATGLTFARRSRLRRDQLDRLYSQHPLAARVVDRLPYDAFREGWEFGDVVSTDDKEIDGRELHKRVQDQLHVDEEFARAVSWSRLYGGSLACLGLVDGRKPWEPVDWANLQGITRPVIVAADDAIPTQYDAAFGSETYRQILEYQLVGLTGSASMINVHHSRVVRFEPIDIPLEARLREGSPNGWGPPVVERIFDDLGRTGSALNHAVSMLYIASILFVQINGYREAVKTDEGLAMMRTFLEGFRANLDVLGLAGLDAADKMGSVTHTIPGIHEVIDRCRASLAAAAEMPKEILFNESPAGLNAGQLSGPQEIWFALVSAFQAKILTPAIDRICKLAFRAWQLPIASWEIRWKPLWTKSDEATATIVKTLADADAVYLTAGVIQPEQVFEHRIRQGKMGPLEVAEGDEQESSPLPIGSVTEEDLEAYAQAATPTKEAQISQQDLALNGAQTASLIDIMKSLNVGEITYQQAIGAIGLSFPTARGREAQVIGPPPTEESIAAARAAAGIETPAPEEDPATAQIGTAPAADPLPTDAMDVRDAAKRFGWHTRTLTARMRDGSLPYWQVGGRRSVSAADVAALATRHRQPPPEPVA